MKSKIILFLTFTTLIIACQPQPKPADSKSEVSSAVQEIADDKAAPLVSKMMEAMGGRQKWEALNYVSWTFFGARHLVWDKKNNRVRIESPRDSSVYLVDLNKPIGKYAYNGVEVVDTKKLSARLKRGKSIWINDMYWLFMPFKFYDEGVSVKYLKTDTTLMGVPADVLELTFDKVGDTPENKYEIYIDQKDQLIKQWSFFANADQAEASKIWPWDNYSDFNGLLLSSNRSDQSGPSNVKVYEHLDDKVFTSFEEFKFY